MKTAAASRKIYTKLDLTGIEGKKKVLHDMKL